MNEIDGYQAVLASRPDGEPKADNPDLPEGDVVLARTGWRTHRVTSATGLRQLNGTRVPVTFALAVLGMTEFTAYGGMK